MSSAKKASTSNVLNAGAAKKALSDLKNGSWSSFEEYDSIDLDAAEMMAQYADELYLDGIKSLSVEAAKALAGHGGGQSLSLDGLEQVDKAVAHELARHQGPLALNGLHALPDDVALALASCEYDLSLDGLEVLSENSGLFAHKAGLSLRGFYAMSDAVADKLSTKEGSLTLAFDFCDSITELSPSMAKLLVRMQAGNEIALENLTTLTVEAAKALAGHGGGQSLSLDGLEQVDKAVAHELARHQGPLALNGLHALPDDVALALASCEYDLSLDGLEVLSENSGLFAHKAGLSLRGFYAMSDAVADKLSTKEGSLTLAFDFCDSITELSPSMAKLLVRMQAGNEILLENLTTLTVEAAKELAKHDSVVRLGLSDLSDEVKGILGTVQLELIGGGDDEEMTEEKLRALAGEIAESAQPWSAWIAPKQWWRRLKALFGGEISVEEGDEDSDVTGLRVDIAARGKAVYLILMDPVIDGTKFDWNQFLVHHKENYWELSRDVVCSELEIEQAWFEVKVDLKDVSKFDNKEMVGKGVVKISENKKESYRDLCASYSSYKEEHIVVMWWHDYVNGRSYTWRGVKDFNPELLEVVTYTRVDEEGDQYELIGNMRYNKQEADIVKEEEGSPKTGYRGPWIIEPSKAE